MRLNLCRMWNLSRAELAEQDARSLLHDTALLMLYQESVPNGG